ncbi:hypothetical protein BIU92_00010 [Curtobacterium sp. MCBA15_003]|nr:hypothetical protein BIU92_00010 [Curtobacterium sp. MCBA15_003]OII30836.1 hypothetical protein BIU94_08885 [Curtobacterium sp. MMLR14_006]
MSEPTSPADLPTFIRVGPVADRRFADDGRLVIERDGVEDGSWNGTAMAQYVAPAAALALMLDVLDPEVDERVGAEHRFLLNSREDERGDMRGGRSPISRWAYGTLVDYPIDMQLLAARARLVHTRRSDHPAFDDVYFRHPTTGRFVEQLGPGASWYRNGRRDYFDQVLSFASDPRADRLVKKYRRLWERAETHWSRRATDEQRRREGPWT